MLPPKPKLAKRSATHRSVPTLTFLRGEDARRARRAPTHRGEGRRQGAGGSGASRSRLRVPLRHRHAFAGQKPSVAPGLRGCPLRGFARPVLRSALGTSFCSVRSRGDAAPSRRRLAAALAVAGRQKPVIDVKTGSEQLLI